APMLPTICGPDQLDGDTLPRIGLPVESSPQEMIGRPKFVYVTKSRFGSVGSTAIQSLSRKAASAKRLDCGRLTAIIGSPKVTPPSEDLETEMALTLRPAASVVRNNDA